MKTVSVYQLDHLFPRQLNRLKAAQQEAAQAWNVCMELHKQARMTHTRWPAPTDGHRLKGRFALHSQSVQAVFRAFLTTIDTTRELRKTHPQMKMKYRWRGKRFHPVHWPAQAVSKESGRVLLPMDRGHASLVLPLALPPESGACILVWNDGFEPHVCMEVPQAEHAPGTARTTVDLGEIHLAAVTTNTGAALIVTGRGIRSLKRQRAKQLGRLAQKQSRCTKHSRHWKKLQRAKNKHGHHAERRIRDLRHKATRQVIDFCVENRVGTLFIGNPHGVRRGNKGRHHNQHMARWEYGTDLDSLTHKAKAARILSAASSERGTSSWCPACEHYHKPKNRNWACRACGFRGHRDLVGSVNMHLLAMVGIWSFLAPSSISALGRPGGVAGPTRPEVVSISRSVNHVSRRQSDRETGHTVDAAEKPVRLQATGMSLI